MKKLEITKLKFQKKIISYVIFSFWQIKYLELDNIIHKYFYLLKKGGVPKLKKACMWDNPKDWINKHKD